MRKTIGIIVAVIAVFAISLGVILLINDDTAYVFLEVNPSIQLVVNKGDKVKEVNALNQDAELLLSDMDLVGKDVLDVVTILTDEMIKTSYITDEDLKIIDLNTVSGKDARNKLLNESMKKRIENRLAAKDIIAEINIGGVSEAIRESAEKYGVSNGKMLLISKAIAAGSQYKETELVKMSVKKIQTEIKKSKKDFNESNKDEKEKLRQEKRDRLRMTEAKNKKESN